MLGIIENTENKMGTRRMKNWSLVFTTYKIKCARADLIIQVVYLGELSPSL